ncbi:MAG: hypothetical protein IPN38_14505 [Flavobacteriales bacterium]|nr:hypothetical protein [Flavobacteriales bacterium]
MDAIRADSESKASWMPTMPPNEGMEKMVVQLLTGDARAAVSLFYGKRGTQKLHLTSFKLAKPVADRVGPGYKVRLKGGW